MAYSLQIVVDCHEPHRLADWWAETMGWQVEPSNEDFIRSMVLQGHATEDQTLLHRGVLVWADAAAIAASMPDTQDTQDPPSSDAQPRILFQRSNHAKTGKNRIHWDVRLGGEDKQAVRERLESRGAVFLWEDAQGPHSWFTMADPEGNEFCIS